MQAIYLADQSVNIQTAPNAWRSKCRPRVNSEGDVTEWYLPKGTVIDGDEARLRVEIGQCAPLDEECAQATGKTSAELETAQRMNLAAELGIKGAKDMELFMAEVIEGYAPETTDDNTVYIWGKNRDAWEAAKAEHKTDKGNI